MKGNLYNELSQAYDKLFINNVYEFISNYINEDSKAVNYNMFYPSFGVKKGEYCEFLIFGQACNGWPVDFNVINNIDKKAFYERLLECKSYSNEFYSDSKSTHNPIDWVNVCWSKSTYKKTIEILEDRNYYGKPEYFPFSSFFWNVIYKTICDYNLYDRNSWDWSSKMVWSNLYKIAPPRGNPSVFEKSLQIKLAVQLVKMEIDEINPTFCIVLTNHEWWEPFQTELNPVEFKKSLYSEIDAIQKYRNTLIIVTTRRYRSGNEKHVSQILEILKKYK